MIPITAISQPKIEPKSSFSVKKGLKALGCFALLLGSGSMGVLAQPSQNALSPISHSVCPIEDRFFSLTYDEFFVELKYFDPSKDEILAFIRSNKDSMTNSQKIEIIDYMNSALYSDFSSFIEELNPVFNDSDFNRMIKDCYSEKLAMMLIERYQPVNLDLSILNSTIFFKYDILFEFISKHCRHILKDVINQLIIQGRPSINFDFDFFKKLYDIGLEASWYTDKLSGKVFIEKLIRKNDPFLKKIGPEIAHLYPEVLDCIREPQLVISEIDPSSVIVQNGCRTVILGKNGTPLSVPALDASKVFQEMTGMEQKEPSFTVYLNDDHASIAFPDAHFGFYPTETTKAIDPPFLAQEQAFLSTQKVIADRPAGKAPYFLTGAGAAVHSLHSSPFRSVRCTVKDDTSEKRASSKNNQLKLDFYATKAQVQAMRDRVEQIKRNCAAGEKLYNVLKMNCVDFVQEVVAASGIEDDYRSAFSRTQLLNRMRPAPIYAMWAAPGPQRTDAYETWQETLIEQTSPTAISLVFGLSSTLFSIWQRKVPQKTWRAVCSTYDKAKRASHFVYDKTRALCGRRVQVADAHLD